MRSGPAPKIICSDCHLLKRKHSQTGCRGCYQSRKKIAFLAHGIDFPKLLGRTPGKKWEFEILEKALRRG